VRSCCAVKPGTAGCCGWPVLLFGIAAWTAKSIVGWIHITCDLRSACGHLCTLGGVGRHFGQWSGLGLAYRPWLAFQQRRAHAQSLLPSGRALALRYVFDWLLGSTQV
jgi:hypothetical protein